MDLFRKKNGFDRKSGLYPLKSGLFWLIFDGFTDEIGSCANIFFYFGHFGVQFSIFVAKSGPFVGFGVVRRTPAPPLATGLKGTDNLGTRLLFGSFVLTE